MHQNVCIIHPPGKSATGNAQTPVGIGRDLGRTGFPPNVGA